MLEKYNDQINEIIEQIKRRLHNDPYFANVFTYTDEYKKTIYFNGTIKEIPKYTYTSISVPFKDINKINYTVNTFIENWEKRTGDPAAIKSFKSFISLGNDLGWD